MIGGLSAGTEVVKKGESGDWIQIDYEGSEAYVAAVFWKKLNKYKEECDGSSFCVFEKYIE
ncbi:MAG: SH3 domain-containing protein [Blautia marasmi]